MAASVQSWAGSTPSRSRQACAGGFRNISEEEGILQVVISSGVHDLNEIDFAPKAAEEIEAIQRGLVAEFEKTALTFTAGKE